MIFPTKVRTIATGFLMNIRHLAVLGFVRTGHGQTFQYTEWEFWPKFPDAKLKLSFKRIIF
jgi:hypothetical protein